MARPSKYVSRSDLGWGSSPASPASPRSGLVVHYDSHDQNLANKPHADCLAYWRSTRSFHTGTNGWDDIGYSFMACAHGHVLEGRGLNRQQAAQPGGNATHYSVTLATGPNDRITGDQINAVRELRRWLVGDHSNAGAVLGHRDFVATSCPGDAAYALVKDGTFTQPPSAVGGDLGGLEIMLGLKHGDGIPDPDRRVRLLQAMLRRAGEEDALVAGAGGDGVDGQYGDATAEAVLNVRQKMGSTAESGEHVNHYAIAQLVAAIGRREGDRAVDRSKGE